MVLMTKAIRLSLLVLLLASPALAQFSTQKALFGGAPTASAPVNTVAPVASGDDIVGYTLSTTTGTWTGSPAPTYSYQWRNNGSNIGGATSSTYVVDSANVAGPIDCNVTATNASGSATKDSNDLTQWLPSNLANLLIWYDPSDASTVHATAGAVDTLDDKSGHAYNATATLLLRPTTGTRTINSLNALDYNGTANYLTMPSGVYGASAGSNTVYVVHIADVSTSKAIWNGQDAATGRWRVLSYPTATTIQGCNNSNCSSSPVNLTVTTDTTNPHIDGIVRSGSDLKVFRDGVSAHNAASGNSFTMISAFLGAQPSGSSFYDGPIGEYVAVTSALSSADQNRLGNYMKAKWGVSSWTTVP